METKDEKLVGSVVLVIDKKNGKLLLGERINCFASGTYGIPGGRVHTGEKLLEAAKRELREETSLEALNIKFVGVVRDIYSAHTFIHFVFVCTSYKGEIKTMEEDKCLGWKWFSFNKLPMNTFPAHKKALDIYLNPNRENFREVFNPNKKLYYHDC